MKKFLTSILFLLALSPYMQAQTLEHYLMTAGENNPLLKARYAEYQAALEKVPQAGALPDPEASFNFFLKPMERYMGNQVGEVSIMQMFPWYGSLDAAKTEASYMAKMKFASFNEAKLNLYHEVHTSWLNLYQVDKEAVLLEKELEILRSLERIALAKYTTPTSGGGSSPARSGQSMGSGNTSGSNSASGSSGMSGMSGMGGGSTAPSGSTGGNTGMSGSAGMAPMASSGSSMVDVILIRVQVKELENRLQLLRESRRPEEVNFNNLLNRNPATAVQVTDTLTPVALPVSLALIQDSIRQNHPMLKMYEWDEKAREAELQMAKLMGRPMIGLGVNYMVFQPRMGAGMEGAMSGSNMVMPMVTVTLPVYRKKYNALKREVQYNQQAAINQKEAAEKQLFTELERLLYSYQRSVSTLNLLEDQIMLNEQAIRLLTATYSVGSTGVEEIIRQRQTALNYKQQQLQALTDQHTSVHAINLLMNSHINSGTHDTTK